MACIYVLRERMRYGSKAVAIVFFESAFGEGQTGLVQRLRGDAHEITARKTTTDTMNAACEKMAEVTKKPRSAFHVEDFEKQTVIADDDAA